MGNSVKLNAGNSGERGNAKCEIIEIQAQCASSDRCCWKRYLSAITKLSGSWVASGWKYQLRRLFLTAE
jgi:hypothetical protein